MKNRWANIGFRAVTKLMTEVIGFLLGMDPSATSERDMMEVEDLGKTDRERQKLIREQNILKQVGCKIFRLSSIIKRIFIRNIFKLVAMLLVVIFVMKYD